jgi:hypothetical protein
VERLDVKVGAREEQILTVDSVRACEAASVQSGTTCTTVPVRLCIGTKAFKAAVPVGTFQRTILQQPVTVENVTEEELKNWLKPDRDENITVSDAELEKLIAKADWLYGVRYVFAVDQMLQSIGAAFLDNDMEHLLEPDAEMQAAAIVKLMIERIGPDDFRNGMEAVFRGIPKERGRIGACSFVFCESKRP